MHKIMRYKMKSSMRNNMRFSMRYSIRNSITNAMRNTTIRNIRSTMKDNLGNRKRNNMRNRMRKSMINKKLSIVMSSTVSSIIYFMTILLFVPNTCECRSHSFTTDSTNSLTINNYVHFWQGRQTRATNVHIMGDNYQKLEIQKTRINRPLSRKDSQFTNLLPIENWSPDSEVS